MADDAAQVSAPVTQMTDASYEGGTPGGAPIQMSLDDPLPYDPTAGMVGVGLGKGKGKSGGRGKGKGIGRGKAKGGKATGKGKGKGGMVSGVKREPLKAMSQSKRAGLNFPVGRLHRMMRDNLTHGKRVSGTGAVYLAAVLEYLCAEILQLAGDCAVSQHQKRISPRHLMISIRRDLELDEFIKATIATGGVLPHNARQSKGWFEGKGEKKKEAAK